SKLRQQMGDALTHLMTMQNHINRTMFQQKFAALETFRQFLAHGLLDNPRARETNQSVRFSNIEVTQHSEAGRYTTKDRIGHHRNVRYAFLLELLKYRRGLGHLHQ